MAHRSLRCRRPASASRQLRDGCGLVGHTPGISQLPMRNAWRWTRSTFRSPSLMPIRPPCASRGCRSPAWFRTSTIVRPVFPTVPLGLRARLTVAEPAIGLRLDVPGRIQIPVALESAAMGFVPTAAVRPSRPRTRCRSWNSQTTGPPSRTAHHAMRTCIRHPHKLGPDGIRNGYLEQERADTSALLLPPAVRLNARADIVLPYAARAEKHVELIQWNIVVPGSPGHAAEGVNGKPDRAEEGVDCISHGQHGQHDTSNGHRNGQGSTGEFMPHRPSHGQ